MARDCEHPGKNWHIQFANSFYEFIKQRNITLNSDENKVDENKVDENYVKRKIDSMCGCPQKEKNTFYVKDK